MKLFVRVTLVVCISCLLVTTAKHIGNGPNGSIRNGIETIHDEFKLSKPTKRKPSSHWPALSTPPKLSGQNDPSIGQVTPELEPSTSGHSPGQLWRRIAIFVWLFFVVIGSLCIIAAISILLVLSKRRKMANNGHGWRHISSRVFGSPLVKRNGKSPGSGDSSKATVRSPKKPSSASSGSSIISLNSMTSSGHHVPHSPLAKDQSINTKTNTAPTQQPAKSINGPQTTKSPQVDQIQLDSTDVSTNSASISVKKSCKNMPNKSQPPPRLIRH